MPRIPKSTTIVTLVSRAASGGGGTGGSGGGGAPVVDLNDYVIFDDGSNAVLDDGSLLIYS